MAAAFPAPSTAFHESHFAPPTTSITCGLATLIFPSVLCLYNLRGSQRWDQWNISNERRGDYLPIQLQHHGIIQSRSIFKDGIDTVLEILVRWWQRAIASIFASKKKLPDFLLVHDRRNGWKERCDCLLTLYWWKHEGIRKEMVAVGCRLVRCSHNFQNFSSRLLNVGTRQ